MLCHTERRQILFSGFATREARSPSSVSDADICRGRRESSVTIPVTPAGLEDNNDDGSEALRVVFKKGQKHFLNKPSSHLDLSA